jgi:lysophospholipase L1-like esterase
MIKKIVSVLVQFVVWLVLICLVAEIALRLFGGYGHSLVYQPDERLLWVPEPGVWKDIVTQARTTISPDGFRYPVKLEPKTPGQVRIFAFGDSVTQGWGMDDDHTYSADLQKLLSASNCRASNFQVISAGVNAYPNSIVLERMTEVVESNFQPDLVIVGYSFNTGYENFADLQGDNRQALLRRVKMKSIVRRSALYEYLIENVLRHVVYYRLKKKILNGSWNTTYDPNTDVQKYKERLHAAHALCLAHHIPMVMIIFGSDGQMSGVAELQGATLEFAKAENVPIINMIDAWGHLDHTPLYIDHNHPSAEGHELIAEQLLPLIKAQLPACAAANTTSAAATEAPAHAAQN